MKKSLLVELSRKPPGRCNNTPTTIIPLTIISYGALEVLAVFSREAMTCNVERRCTVHCVVNRAISNSRLPNNFGANEDPFFSLKKSNKKVKKI